MAKDDKWVQVDAYCVASSEEESYRADREELAKQALFVFAKHFHSASRQWAGSQDGEAVLGLDEKGQLKALIHLDPNGIELLKENPAADDFEKALLEYNGYSIDGELL